MKKIIALISALAVFSACALISPYTITFTTSDEKVVNPNYDTLDFVVNTPTLAYISGVQCDDEDPLELLPVITDDMEISKAHNLSLDVLADQSPGAKCEVTVTAFDQTTTANARETITLYVYENFEIVEDEEAVVEEEVVEEDTCEEGEEDTACQIEETTEETTNNNDETTEPSEDSSGEEPAA